MEFSKTITIGKHTISENDPVFVIAEIGVNHDGSLEQAFRLIDEAKNSGADAVKFQSFTADRLTIKEAPKVRHHKDPDNPEESHYEMLKKLEIDEDFQKKVFDYCTKKDVTFISTPYDVESAKFLTNLGVKVFKTASADMVDLPLHEYLASTGTPVIMAAGMATMEEIETVLEIYKRHNNPNVVLLHCTASYPASYESLNIKVINSLKDKFNILIGYSDHSIGDYAAITSVAYGATVIEKHFTLDRSLPGPDHPASIEPDDLKKFAESIRITQKILGSADKKSQPEELDMRAFSRKSIVSKVDIPSGVAITEDMLYLKRPGTGTYWVDRDKIIGRESKENIPKDTLITDDLLS